MAAKLVGSEFYKDVVTFFLINLLMPLAIVIKNNDILAHGKEWVLERFT